MATVTRENMELLNDKITITLQKEDYLPAFDKSLKNYAKTANIPGFRKGMVPTSMVKKMYGTSVYTDEVLRTVEKELNTYMTNEKLDIFAQPLPLENDARQLDMNNPVDYTFSFEIGLKPALDINLDAMKVTRHKVDITDAMIDEEVERLQTRHGKMTEPGEVSQDENVLNITFTETDAEGNVVEGGISKGNSLLVKYFTEDFKKKLMGKKNDDSITLQLTEAFDEKEREWLISDLGISAEDAASKHFIMNITKVGLIEKPEMDEAFFEAAYPGKEIKDEAGVREAVKNEIQARYDGQSRNQLHDQIYHQLIDNTQMEFPEGFLKRWMQKGGEKEKTAEEAESEYPGFANSLKWTLISTKLLEENDVQVGPEEIKEFAKVQVMSYMGMQNMDDAPWLESYAESMLKDKKFIENTYYQLQTSKLFEVLEGKITPAEDTISVDELAAMQHNHQH